MALSEQMKQEMKRDVFSIQSHEERKAVQLSKFEKKLSPEQQQLLNVNAAAQENLKIRGILSNSKELNLSEEDRTDLLLRQNRNENFLFVNQEKWGGDSPVMAAIKKQLSSYETLLHEKTSSEKDREQMADTAVSMCDAMIRNCETYLDRGKSFFFWRRSRYDSVVQLKKRIENEKKLLSEVGSKDFAEKYQRVTDETDSLRDLIAVPALKGRLRKLKGRAKEDNNARNNPIALTKEDLETVRKERIKQSRQENLREKEEKKEEKRKKKIEQAKRIDERNPILVTERRKRTKESDDDFKNPIALTEEDYLDYEVERQLKIDEVAKEKGKRLKTERAELQKLHFSTLLSIRFRLQVK